MTKTIERPGIPLPPLPKIDDVTRREFLIGAAGLLLLPAGCGSGEDGGEASGETKIVRHALGETEVPENPRRIVCVYRSPDLAHLIALGVKPTASAAFYESGPPFHPAIPEEDYEGVEPLYFPAGEINLEKVAALEPDLILGQDSAIEQVYDELTEIAPAVVTPWTFEGDSWKEDFLFIGEVVGKRDLAEERLRELDVDVGETRNALGDLDVTVSMAAVDSEGVTVYNDRLFAGSILKELGIPVVSDLEEDAFEEEPQQIYGLSLERLPALNGDVLFMLQDDRLEGEEEAFRKARALPLWDRVPAVQSGRVYQVNRQIYYDGTVQGARTVLREFERYLVG